MSAELGNSWIFAASAAAREQLVALGLSGDEPAALRVLLQAAARSSSLARLEICTFSASASILRFLDPSRGDRLVVNPDVLSQGLYARLSSTPEDARATRLLSGLHAKIFRLVFKSGQELVIVGSSNATHGGFGANVEANVALSYEGPAGEADDPRALLEAIWAAAEPFDVTKHAPVFNPVVLTVSAPVAAGLRLIKVTSTHVWVYKHYAADNRIQVARVKHENVAKRAAEFVNPPPTAFEALGLDIEGIIPDPAKYSGLDDIVSLDSSDNPDSSAVEYRRRYDPRFRLSVPGDLRSIWQVYNRKAGPIEFAAE